MMSYGLQRPFAKIGTWLAPCLAGLALVPAAHVAPLIDVEHSASLTHRRGCAAREAKPFARTELFFGSSRPGGTGSEQEVKNFLDANVTPRFPDGLTLLVPLVPLVPLRRGEAHSTVEAIRNEYKARFQQESVLRADETSCVSF